MIVFLAVAALLVAAIALFMNRPEFGRAPRGERLERIWRSPNYRDGAFRNRHATPQLTSGKGWWATMYDFLFERKERNRPDHALPAVKTDLKALDPKENLLVWFGHSSYLIQADGLRILVDPVFETASPLPFFNRPFEGTDLYKPEDMPGIDLLVITHDHWDHLDYGTVTKLRDRTGRVVDACKRLIEQHQARCVWAASSSVEAGNGRKQWNGQTECTFPAGGGTGELAPLAILMPLYAESMPAAIIQRHCQLFDQA